MAYGNYRRRRGYGRKRFRTRGYYPGRRQELKFLDAESTAAVNLASQTWTSCTEGNSTTASGGCLDYGIGSGGRIDQGTNANERIGRRISVKSLHLRGFLRINKNTTSTTIAERTDHNIRLMVLLDRQTNGVGLTPTGMEWLSDIGLNNMKFNDLYNMGRFRVLYDKNHHLTTRDFSSSTYDIREYTKYININMRFGKGLLVTYDGANATGQVANINDNNIYVLACSQHAGCAVDFNQRLRFTDA